MTDWSFEWLKSQNIESFTKSMLPDAMETTHVIITCIDSSRNVRDVLDRHAIPYDGVDSQAVVGFERWKSLVRDLDILNGFDEVWFSPCFPDRPVPDEFSIVSPCESIFDLPPRFGQWFVESPFQLGLGDGYGLTVVSKPVQSSRSGMTYR